MSKDKQILEMTNDLCDIECKGMKCKVCDNGCEYSMLSEALYNAGYRKHINGVWERRTWLFLNIVKDGYRCSECNTTWDTPTKFCPNCGAKMKGGAE